MVVEFPGQIQHLLFFVFLGGGGVYDDICDCLVFCSALPYTCYT